jgi:hypothetical protein
MLFYIRRIYRGGVRVILARSLFSAVVHFVIVGVHYIEKFRIGRFRHFLLGSAVVGVAPVISRSDSGADDWPAVVAIAAFLIAFLKRDVALVALGAMLCGIIYSTIRTLA